MDRREALKFYYDDRSPISIEDYAQGLIGMTFEEILAQYFKDDFNGFRTAVSYFENPRGKGSLGNLVQEYYFGIEANNSPEPDFEEAGVELKVSPYEVTNKGKIRAGERMVIGMIPNNQPVPESFENSHLFEKLQLILLVLYWRDRNLNRLNYRIDFSQLIHLQSQVLKEDFATIKSDYDLIVSKIREGRAHELSESDTMYLSACTKGATAASSLQPQYYNSEVLAKRRAFAFKQSYMTFVINNYIFNKAKTYDAIIERAVPMPEFEQIVLDKIATYVGLSEYELRVMFNLVGNKSKDLFSMLTLRILGVYTGNAEEFEKSNTVIKTIRIEEDGSIKEHMSFPYVSFHKLIKEQWEESGVYEFLSETRFLFVLYTKKNDEYFLKGAKFWNMPNQDLEEIVKHEWLLYKNRIERGVKFIIKNNRVFNNLPKATQTKIIHMRPHATKAAYLINGIEYGNGDIRSDSDTLPDGNMMTKQCFWLNKGYLEGLFNF